MDAAEALAAAGEALARDAEGALPLGPRKTVWLSLAARQDSRLAHQRRVALNIACVQRVEPIWTRRFPGKEIDDMLGLAERVVAGSVDVAAADLMRDRFYTTVVDNRKYGDDWSPMFVGHAAAGTVTDAMIADNGDAMPSVDDDEALDPESYQPSYMAASAAAGGLNGRPADIVARRAFWTWYLRTAIPQIYQF